MTTRRTTKCKGHKHPEIQFNYDPAIVPVAGDVEWFVGWLEDAVARGEKFADGETVQVGWGLLLVSDAGKGMLSISEPDMIEMPIVWVDSVSNTLAQLRRQKDVCESVLSADDISFPSLLESAIICTRLSSTGPVVMDRSTPKGADSGWFLGCVDEDHDHNTVDELQRVSLYEAAVCYAPQIIPFLALPPGVLLEIGDCSLAIFRGEEELEIKPGSYLAARYGGSGGAENK